MLLFIVVLFIMNVLYIIVMLFIVEKLMFFVVEGFNFKKVVIVILKYNKEISVDIYEMIGRGVILLSGKGVY